MESNRPWIIAVLFLALVFVLFMFSIKGLRFEKVAVENKPFSEVHLIWDWNKAADWFHGLHSTKPGEQNPEEGKAPQESQPAVK